MLACRPNFTTPSSKKKTRLARPRKRAVGPNLQRLRRGRRYVSPRNGQAGQQQQTRNGLVGAPVAVSSTQQFRVRAPMTRQSRFSNSELIATVQGTVGFTAIKYVANPGLAATFPWLAVEASKWEQYRFHMLRFRYVTRTGTSTVGSVILSPEYSVRDPAPLNEVQATDTQDAVEDVPWAPISTTLDVAAMYPSGPRKLIRLGPTTGDINLYDSANLYVCTLEMAAAASVGKLWVDYDVEFFVPQNSAEAGTLPSATSFATRGADQKYSSGAQAVVDFGNFLPGFDPLGIGNPVAGVYTPPAGVYYVEAAVVGFDASTGDVFQNSLEWVVDGKSPAPITYTQQLLSASFGTQGKSALNIWGLITLNGSQTFQVLYTALSVTNGATTTIPGNTARILFQPA